MSRVLTLTTTLLLVVAVALAPAFGHDQLVSSSPSSGEQLGTAPEQVSVTFSGEVMQIAGSGVGLMVVDAQGTDWVAGPVQVDGRTVSADLNGPLPDAGYELRWRAVSADGHPVSGVIPFTVGGPQATTSTSTSGPESTPSPSTSPSATSSQSPSEASAQSATSSVTEPSGGPLRVVLIAVAGALLALAVLAVARLAARGSRRDSSGGSASGGRSSDE